LQVAREIEIALAHEHVRDWKVAILLWKLP